MAGRSESFTGGIISVPVRVDSVSRNPGKDDMTR